MFITSFSWDFYRRIHLKYYFDDSRSSLRSKSQCQGHAVGNIIFITNKAMTMCNTTFAWDF